MGYDGNVSHNWHAIPHGEGLQQVSHGIPSMRGSHPSNRGIFASPEARPVAPPIAGAVIDRMREVAGVSTDIELAEHLNLGRSAPSNWRSRNRVPIESCVELAVARGVSLDWLLFGEGEAVRGAAQVGSDQAVPAGHVALDRLKGFDTSPGPDRLILPSHLLRQRGIDDDVTNIRWMVNPVSSLAPRLPKGGVLLVDTRVASHQDVEDGETYVVRFSGRIIVRRIFIIGPNEYRLRGDRERDDRRDLTGKDYEHLELGGKVVDVI